ncbi:MAG: hypothetical protein ABH843_07620 [Candidatus Omnitrophota bacterium]
MAMTVYYLIKDYNPDVDYSDGVIISLMPKASFLLGEAGIRYKTLEDYYDEKQLRRDEDKYFFSQLSWFEGFDDFLKSQIRYCSEHSIRPAKSFYRKMKYFIDTLIIQSMIMREFIAKIGQEAELRYVRDISGNVQTRTCSMQIFNETEGATFFPEILGILTRERKEITLRFLDFYSKRKQSAEKRDFRTRLKNVARSLSIKRQIKLLYHFLKYKKYFLLKSSKRGKDGAKRLAFLHSGNVYMDFLIQELIKKGDDIFYLSNDVIYRCNDALERAEWKIGKDYDKEAPAAVIYEDCRRAADRLSAETGIFGWLNINSGLDLFELIFPYFKYFVSETCPEILSRSVSFRKFFEDFNIDYVVGLTSTDINSMSALIAAKQLPRMGSIGIQHGIEAYDERIWHMTDIDAFDYYLAADEFSEKRYKECVKLDYVSPCIIYRSSHYLSSIKNGNGKKNAKRSTKRVLYIPTKRSTYIKFFNNITYPVLWYFEYQKQIIDLFAKFSRHDFIFKRAATKRKWAYEAIVPYILNKNYKNVFIETRPVSYYQGRIDAIILDRPTTALFESAMMGIPFLCLYHEIAEPQICAETAAFFGKRLRSFEDFNKAKDIITTFLDSLETKDADEYVVDFPLTGNSICDIVHNPALIKKG